jgi:hypothetical protein
MTQALELITDAMLKAGVAAAEQPLDAATTQLGLRVLNRLMDSLANESMLIFDIIENSFSMVPGQASYSTTLLAKRPINVSYVFVRQGVGNTPVDYPVDLIDAQEYAALQVKQISSLPRSCYYDSGAPNGLFYFYPTPSSTYEAHIGFYDTLQTFADTTVTVTFPPGYQHMIVASLAVRLCPFFGKQATPEMLEDARDSKAVIKRTNYRSPIMAQPAPLAAKQFNIYSGA